MTLVDGGKTRATTGQEGGTTLTLRSVVRKERATMESDGVLPFAPALQPSVAATISDGRQEHGGTDALLAQAIHQLADSSAGDSAPPAPSLQVACPPSGAAMARLGQFLALWGDRPVRPCIAASPGGGLLLEWEHERYALALHIRASGEVEVFAQTPNLVTEGPLRTREASALAALEGVLRSV